MPDITSHSENSNDSLSREATIVTCNESLNKRPVPPADRLARGWSINFKTIVSFLLSPAWIDIFAFCHFRCICGAPSLVRVKELLFLRRSLAWFDILVRFVGPPPLVHLEQLSLLLRSLA